MLTKRENKRNLQVGGSEYIRDQSVSHKAIKSKFLVGFFSNEIASEKQERLKGD